MISRFLVSLGTFALTVVVAVGLTLIRPAQIPEPVVIELAHRTKITCPVPGQALVGGSADVEVRPVGDGAPSELNAPGATDLVTAADLRADVPISGGVLTSEPEAFAPCLPPRASGIVLVPDPDDVEFLLVNSDASGAAVDLTLLGPSGEVEVLGARGIAVSGASSRRVALSVLAEEGPVGVAFNASQGRVALLATNLEGRPTQFAAPGPLASEHTIAGIPAAGTATQLIVSNPLEDRVDVDVVALGESSAFTPVSAESVSVPAHSTVGIDLGSDLAAEASALLVSAPTQIGAAVVTTLAGGQPTNLTHAEPAAELGAYVPARSGSLLLTNPAEDEVSAQVSFGEQTTDLTIPARRTASLPVPESGAAVRVKASGALTGAVVSGSVIIGLGATEVPERETGTAVLDPALR